MKHRKKPIVIEAHRIGDDGWPDAIWVDSDCESVIAQQIKLADAKRVVACVNACAGIDDPLDLRKQRDELAEVLRDCIGLLETFVGTHENSEGAVDFQIAEARAVLSRLGKEGV